MNALTTMGVFVAGNGHAECIRLKWNIYWPVPRAGERLWWADMVDDDMKREIITRFKTLYDRHLTDGERSYLQDMSSGGMDGVIDSGVAAHILRIIQDVYGTRVADVQYRVVDNEYRICLVMQLETEDTF